MTFATFASAYFFVMAALLSFMGYCTAALMCRASETAGGRAGFAALTLIQWGIAAFLVDMGLWIVRTA